jgi:hypothetical protein
MSAASLARQRVFAGIETGAHLTQEFQPAYILSLLRTRAYIDEELRTLPPEERESTLCRRTERQSIILDETKRFRFLMTEGALRWRVGSADLMIEQLQHIASLCARPNVAVGIIPWRERMTVFAGHAFHIYDEDAVVVGTAHAVEVLRDPAVIQRYARLFTRLWTHARTGEDAIRELRRLSGQFVRLSRREQGGG